MTIVESAGYHFRFTALISALEILGKYGRGCLLLQVDELQFGGLALVHLLYASRRPIHVIVELADRVHLLDVQNVRCWLVLRCGLLGQPFAKWIECGCKGRKAPRRCKLTLPLAELEMHQEHFGSPVRCIHLLCLFLLITKADTVAVKHW